MRHSEKQGSEYWIRKLVNSKIKKVKTSLNECIGRGNIDWLSPLEDDITGTYKEYRLNRGTIAKDLGFEKRLIKNWWPSGSPQPQWDAIGKTENGTIILVEAKAHIGETRTSCRASDKSKMKILDSFKLLHKELEAKTDFDEVKDIWLNEYYQTANRLLFLQNLNKYLDSDYVNNYFNPLKKSKVLLVFLNFVGTEYKKTSEKEWNEHTDEMIRALLGYGLIDLNRRNGIKFINYDVRNYKY